MLNVSKQAVVSAEQLRKHAKKWMNKPVYALSLSSCVADLPFPKAFIITLPYIAMPSYAIELLIA
jgi:uncharacterized membrane protein